MGLIGTLDSSVSGIGWIDHDRSAVQQYVLKIVQNIVYGGRNGHNGASIDGDLDLQKGIGVRVR